MTRAAQVLDREFPDDADKIRRLRIRDAVFAKLVEDYDVVTRAVHRAEARIEAIDVRLEVVLRQKKGHLHQALASALARS